MHLFIFQDPFFDQLFFENPIENYLWFFLILIVGFVTKRFISIFLTRQLFRICKKYSTGVGPEKFLSLLMAPFNLFVMLVIFYLAFSRLEYPASWNLAPGEVFGIKMIVYKVYLIWVVVSITWIFLRSTDYFGLILLHRASLTESKSDDQLVPFIKESIKIVIGMLSLFFILGSIFQVNVASLIAGLGLGGLAVALAAKESIENLLGSFTIFLDKPFTIGDLVKIDKTTGHVEKIGFRSTRLRTQDKTFVTIPNKKMVDAELENLTLRNHFRVVFSIGLTYEADSGSIKNITEAIRDLLKRDTMLTEDHVVRFTEFNTSSLDILVVYFVKTSDWETYLEIRERINFELLDIIKKSGCSFAYQTQRIMVEQFNETERNKKDSV